jgi:HAD superfamily hydrolase (TIGR01509 family)
MDQGSDERLPIRAVVFDFDGLILDTESAAFRTWSELYAAHGASLVLERWVHCVGTDSTHFDPYSDLEQQLGHPLDRAQLRVRMLERLHALSAEESIRPGVLDVLERARALGLAIGLASSSSRDWLDHHLERLALRPHFAAIASRDDVQRVKPDPELYLRATTLLGVDPAQALAIEDSPNGIRAAKRAGLRCVAVPNPITAGLPLHEADLVVDSLGSLGLDAILTRL